MSVLGFLATGTFQREIGDQSGISQSSLSRILPDVRRGIIPLCPKCITFPYSAQEQRNVKEDFLRKTGFPMASHPDCAHSDSLGSPLQYSTCPCAVGSGAQHRHAEGKVAMFGCIGRETAICPRKGLPDHPSLLCATQHLSKPWHRARRRRNAHGPR